MINGHYDKNAPSSILHFTTYKDSVKENNPPPTLPSQGTAKAKKDSFGLTTAEDGTRSSAMCCLHFSSLL